MALRQREIARYIPPTVVFASRNGKLVHQPVIAGGVAGLGDLSIAPTAMYRSAGYTQIPAMDVAQTRAKIAAEETLRFAPAGPGVPGTFSAPSRLREQATGRILGARAATTATTPSRSAPLILTAAGSISPAEQPLGPGVSPTGVSVTEEEMDRLRAEADAAAASPASDFLAGLSFGKIAGGIVGFAAGFGLLLLRRS